MFMTTTSREPNTVTVTALKRHDTPRTTACLFGTFHIENTLAVDKTIAPAKTNKKILTISGQIVAVDII